MTCRRSSRQPRPIRLLRHPTRPPDGAAPASSTSAATAAPSSKTPPEPSNRRTIGASTFPRSHRRRRPTIPDAHFVPHRWQHRYNPTGIPNHPLPLDDERSIHPGPLRFTMIDEAETSSSSPHYDPSAKGGVLAFTFVDPHHRQLRNGRLISNSNGASTSPLPSATPRPGMAAAFADCESATSSNNEASKPSPTRLRNLPHRRPDPQALPRLRNFRNDRRPATPLLVIRG